MSRAFGTTPSERPADRCVRCGRSSREHQLFLLDGAPYCLRDALRRWSLLRRSFLTALVVGTVLTAINHGDALLAGEPTHDLIWKVPLTYSVPFCVSIWGALINTRLPRTGSVSDG